MHTVSAREDAEWKSVCLLQLEIKMFHTYYSAISKEQKQMYLLACVLTVIIEKECKCDSIWEPGPLLQHG